MSKLWLPKSAIPEPPEHRLRPMIRKLCGELSAKLGNYEMTTHGSGGPFTIEGVADALVKAYNSPSSFTISELYQRAEKFWEDAAKASGELP